MLNPKLGSICVWRLERSRHPEEVCASLVAGVPSSPDAKRSREHIRYMESLFFIASEQGFCFLNQLSTAQKYTGIVIIFISNMNLYGRSIK